MGVLLLVLLLALILGGLGFAVHVLWWVALIVLAIWLIGFFMRSADRGARWYRWSLPRQRPRLRQVIDLNQLKSVFASLQEVSSHDHNSHCHDNLGRRSHRWQRTGCARVLGHRHVRRLVAGPCRGSERDDQPRRAHRRCSLVVLLDGALRGPRQGGYAAAAARDSRRGRLPP